MNEALPILDTYYFVACEHRSKDGDSRKNIISNQIIKNIHPLIWAATPPPPYGQYFSTYILFWEVIPETVALNDAVQRHFS